MGLIQPSGRPSLKPTFKLKSSFRRPSNPKKFIKPFAVLLVIAVAVASVFYYFGHKDKTQSTTADKAEPCSIFTLDDAKSLLGSAAQKGGLAPMSAPSAKEFTSVTCSYTQKLQTNGQAISAQSLKSASVIVRTPKTSLATSLNQFVFAEGKPKDAQDVPGYGDKAYWDPAQGVLNILKDNKWVTLSSGVIQPTKSYTLDDAKKMANIVMPKL